MTGTFLTAEWRSLAMFNFLTPPELLQPFVPSGTILDAYEGRTYLSLVGFQFHKTRLLGIPIPGHRNFDEVNLRFYVRRELQAETRRGVTFIKEIVPRWAIAKVARWCYNEPYVALPMWSRCEGLDEDAAGTPARVEYGWQDRARSYRMSVAPTGPPEPLLDGSLEAFLTEHFWGYCAQRDGSTLEYNVRHPSWWVWRDCHGELGGDFHSLYGTSFGDVLAAPPASVLLAVGSPVSVGQPTRI